MPTWTIQLKTIRDVQEFVRTVNDFRYEIDLSEGHYVVDAKSIMGILSLDLGKPLLLDIHAADCADLIKRLESYIIR
jgi:phosphocarrier protein HPr